MQATVAKKQSVSPCSLFIISILKSHSAFLLSNCNKDGEHGSLSVPSMVESSKSVYVQVTKPSGRVMTPVSWEPRGTFSVTAL